MAALETFRIKDEDDYEEKKFNLNLFLCFLKK